MSTSFGILKRTRYRSLDNSQLICVSGNCVLLSSSKGGSGSGVDSGKTS